MPDNYATKEDIANLRAELFGNIPPKFENDVGRIGKMEQAIILLPATVKKEISGLFKNWKGVALFIIAVGTFLITAWNAINK